MGEDGFSVNVEWNVLTIRVDDSEGQRREIFLRAISRLSELNALLASAKITASVSCDSCILRIACIAASHPAICPAHTWSGPAASWISSRNMVAMVLFIMRLMVSPTLMGLIPGHLSRAMSRQATSGIITMGSTNSVQILLVAEAKALQRSVEAIM